MAKRKYTKKIKYPKPGEDGVTKEIEKIAYNRVEPLIDHYGKNIRFFNIQQLAASCYLQGLVDMGKAAASVESERTKSMDSFDPVI